MPKKIARSRPTTFRRRVVTKKRRVTVSRKLSVRRAVGVKHPGALKMTTLNSAPWLGPGTAITLGTLYCDNFVWPVASDRSNRPYITVDHLKINRFFYYGNLQNSALDIGAITVRWALIQMKSFTGSNVLRNGAALTAMQPEFFTRRTNNADTYQPHVPYIAVGDTWRQYFHTYPINPEGVVRVLMQKKFTLVARSPNSQCAIGSKGAGLPSEKHLRFNVPIKKAVSWSSSSNLEPDDMFYEIFWYNCTSPQLFPVAAPVANPYLAVLSSNGMAYKEVA